MGKAGFARSGMGRGTAGIGKVSAPSIVKSARGEQSFTEKPPHDGQLAVEPGADISQFEPAVSVPNMRPREISTATEVGFNPDASPVKNLPMAAPAAPTVPQDRPRNIVK